MYMYRTIGPMLKTNAAILKNNAQAVVSLK
jgi:hypothetical protein